MTLPFRLLLITDWSIGARELTARLAEALATDARIAVQHRNPLATGRVFFEQASQLHDLCRETETPLFINARVDVALGLNAHLHLPGQAPRVSTVRPVLPAGRLISTVVHAADDLENSQGADLALVSPVFAAGSKVNDTRTPLGVSGFHALKERLACPAFALGGISGDTVSPLGAVDGVACISAVWQAREVGRAVEALLRPWPVNLP